MRLIVCGIVLALMIGCGGDYSQQAEAVATVAASGTLTFKGKPLSGFQVAFHPADGKRPALGITDEAGKFVLGTNTRDDGVVAGISKVSVVWQSPEDDGMGNVIDDPSKLPKAPVQIPAKYASPETSGIQVEVPDGGSSELTVALE